MKGKMLHHIWLWVGLVVSLALVACAPAAKKVETGPEPDIISRDGFYKDNKIGFSLAWPAEVFSVKGDLQGVERVRVTHPATVPVLTIAVAAKKADAAPLSELGEVFVQELKDTQIGSKRFKLRESKVVRLANGVEAAYTMVTWKYGGTRAMVTVAMMVYKGDNLVTATVTAPPGQPPVQVLDRWVMALNVMP